MSDKIEEQDAYTKHLLGLVANRRNSEKKDPSYENSFEGPEKLLEVWFTPIQDDNGVFTKGLRSVTRKRWEEMLDLVHCTILSVKSNEHFDAYLLSESSLFVYAHHVIIKTCGTTTLLFCVEKLLEIAYNDAGLCSLDDVFYSRKNFFFPDRQLTPHNSFEDEAKFLDQFFDGSAYIVGKINHDHWYLYTTDKDVSISNPILRNQVPLKPATRLKRPQSLVGFTMDVDITLEIIMTDVDEEKMRQFYRRDGPDGQAVTAKEITESSGISGLIPGMDIDDFLFDPMGYSCNGLMDSAYFTIHITPQPHCSYVSFETNVAYDNYTALIERVLTVFRPASATITLFNGHVDTDEFEGHVTSTFKENIMDLRRTTKTVYDFENNYKLIFSHYIRGVGSTSSICGSPKGIFTEK